MSRKLGTPSTWMKGGGRVDGVEASTTCSATLILLVLLRVFVQCSICMCYVGMYFCVYRNAEVEMTSMD